MPKLNVGDRLPDVILYEGKPSNEVSTSQLTRGKKVVLFGIPGAFTPICTEKHLPSYLEDYEKFKKNGVDEIVCVAANDPYVMKAFGQEMHAEGKIRFLSDNHAEFCKAAGVDLDLTEELGGIRCNRFSMLVDDGIIQELNIEPDGQGVSVSMADHLLEAL